jgi:hypothetical protein
MKHAKKLPAVADLSPACRDAIRALEESGNLRSTAANNVLPSGAINNATAHSIQRLAQRTSKRQDAAWTAPSNFMVVLP